MTGTVEVSVPATPWKVSAHGVQKLVVTAPTVEEAVRGAADALTGSLVASALYMDGQERRRKK